MVGKVGVFVFIVVVVGFEVLVKITASFRS
jgi:hypothetical protein